MFTHVNSRVRFQFSQEPALDLDVETWAMGIAHGDLSKNTTSQSCIYHLPPERTIYRMRISESQRLIPAKQYQLWEVV